MKKVLIAFDGKHFSKGAFEFAEQMNAKSPLLLTGVFLPAVEFTEILYSLGGLGGPVFVEEDKQDEATMNRNVDLFITTCEEKNIKYRLHKNPVSNIVANLAKETRYSDVLLLGSETFYENLGEETQDDYIHNVVHHGESPILLLPEKYSAPESIILAYDGSASSMFAIKQFAYLFPEYAAMKAIIVFMSGDKKEIPELVQLEEFAACHFKDVTIFKLDADPRKYFDTWLLENPKSMVVAGSFARSFISELVKKSFLDSTIHEHKLPVFIAHK